MGSVDEARKMNTNEKGVFSIHPLQNYYNNFDEKLFWGVCYAIRTMRYEKSKGTNFENICIPAATSTPIFYRASKTGSLNKKETSRMKIN
jgi:hypothetical protein